MVLLYRDESKKTEGIAHQNEEMLKLAHDVIFSA
jgi:hypothetical protein